MYIHHAREALIASKLSYRTEILTLINICKYKWRTEKVIYSVRFAPNFFLSQVGRDDSLDPKNKVKIYDPDQESAWQGRGWSK